MARVARCRGRCRGAVTCALPPDPVARSCATRDVGLSAAISTPYVNTIPPEAEPWFPGDEHLERRIRAYVRWNAVAMVDRANHLHDGLGGHLSTYARRRSTRWASTTSSTARTTAGTAIRCSSRAMLRPASTHARSWRVDSPRPSSTVSAGRSVVTVCRRIPPPAHARLLGVPDGLHGARTAECRRAGAHQPVPAPPRARRHEPFEGLVLRR